MRRPRPPPPPSRWVSGSRPSPPTSRETAGRQAHALYRRGRRRPAPGRPRPGPRHQCPSWKTSARPSCYHRAAAAKPRPRQGCPPCNSLSTKWTSGEVEMLLILGGNPGLHGPGRSRVRRRIGKAPAARPSRPVPGRDGRPVRLAHPRGALPGKLGRRPGLRRHGVVIQPLIAPLFGGRSAHELLAALLDEVAATRLRHRPRAYWRRDGTTADGDFERSGGGRCNDGVIAGTAVGRSGRRR